MRIQVTGKDLTVGQNLTNYITQSLESQVTKYFSHAINSRVVINKEGYNFHVEIFVNEGVKHGVFIKASGSSHRAYDAVDNAITRINTKLRRYKNKIQDYNKPHTITASQYLISQAETVDHQSSSTFNKNDPQNTEIPVLAVEEAIMHLEFSGTPALLFINHANHQLSMAYEEKYGNITVVEAPHKVDPNNPPK